MSFLGAGRIVAALTLFVQAAFAGLGAGAASAQPSQAEILLSPGSSAEGIDAEFRFLPDVGEAPEAVLEAFRQGQAHDDVRAAVARVTEPYQPIWAYARIQDGGEKDPAAPGLADEWFFVADAYGLLEVEAYVRRGDGRLEYVMSYAYDEPFDPEERVFERLRSAPIALRRGESIELLVRYKFGPLIDALAHFETPQDFRAAAFSQGVRYAAFYSFSLAMVLFFLGFLSSLRSAVGMAYSCLFLLFLLFCAYLDGFAFRFVYPNAPQLHFPFGVALLNGLSAAGFFVAGWSLRQPHLGRFENLIRLGAWLRGAAFAPALILLSTAILPQELVAQLSYLAVLAMLAAQIVAMSQWRLPLDEHDETANRSAPVFQSAAMLAGAAVCVLLVFQLFSGGREAFSPPTYLKLLFATVGLLSMSALTIALMDMGRRHQRALEQRMAALTAEAAEANARLEAERAYAHARELAHLRQRQLASASHDIRQPLAALRLGMRAAEERLTAEQAERIGQSLDYLEGLSSQYLAQTRPDAPREEEGRVEEPTERYRLSVVLGGLREMFTEEAVSKGLTLKVVDSSMETDAPPLAVMRVLSNLVANAVKYTEEGGVLIGVRRRPTRPEIQVLDTGPGLSAEELDRFGQAYQKGDNSDGEGLGLAICHEIAAREGFALSASSEPGRGTMFRLALKASDDAGTSRADQP